MKYFLYPIAFILFTGLNNIHSLSAQQKFANAGEYLNYMNTETRKITRDMWDYTSAVTHGKSARKVENKRKEVLSTIKEAQGKISKMPGYEGDKSLRDSVVAYLKLSHIVLAEDYEKIVDMEEVAEQSYDMMEAYLLAQEKASDKLDAAGESLEEQQKLFAGQHNINLVENKDKISLKLESAGKVIQYYNTLYLIFFKSYKQEAYMLDAINRNDVNGIEQNKNSLAGFAAKGIESLDTMKAFKGDPSLKTSCKEMLAFYKMEANTKIPGMIDYFLKNENFNKMKSALEAKPQSKRSKEEIDQYNKAVKELNESMTKYNSVSQELYKKRSELLNKWNSSVKSFMDKHVPKKR